MRIESAEASVPRDGLRPVAGEGAGMVGIERMDTPAEVVLVETRDGVLVDLGPVIRAAETVRPRVERNPSGVMAVLLGMRIAVGKVCGSEAAMVFEEWVFGTE